MDKYSLEQLKNDELARSETILNSLSEWSNLNEKMHTDYSLIIAKYEEERRQMFKYLGTIAGGAAALAPQLLPYIHQKNIFYFGIGFLLITVITSVSYILSTVENSTEEIRAYFNKQRKLIYEIRKPKIEYLKGSDKSVAAFAKAMSTAGNENIPTQDEPIKEGSGWFRSMDYAGEYIILFTITGLGFLALSLTQHQFSSKILIGGIALIFITINIISTFPVKIFSFLGFPIDLIKSLPRLYKKIKTSNT